MTQSDCKAETCRHANDTELTKPFFSPLVQSKLKEAHMRA